MRTHAVDVDPATDRPPDSVVHVALCGRRLADAGIYALSEVTSGRSIDGLLEARRGLVLYPTGTRPWVSVAEYAMGEDGCEAIDCVECRRRLDDALTRYWDS